jgi:hypothetical protein
MFIAICPSILIVDSNLGIAVFSSCRLHSNIVDFNCAELTDGPKEGVVFTFGIERRCLIVKRISMSFFMYLASKICYIAIF